MKFKVTLARGSFLFGDKVSLYRGNQVTLESKDLGYADLSILGLNPRFDGAFLIHRLYFYSSY